MRVIKGIQLSQLDVPRQWTVFLYNVRGGFQGVPAATHLSGENHGLEELALKSAADKDNRQRGQHQLGQHAWMALCLLACRMHCCMHRRAGVHAHGASTNAVGTQKSLCAHRAFWANEAQIYVGL